jgi:hypothetical protein
MPVFGWCFIPRHDFVGANQDSATGGGEDAGTHLDYTLPAYGTSE